MYLCTHSSTCAVTCVRARTHTHTHTHARTHPPATHTHTHTHTHHTTLLRPARMSNGLDSKAEGVIFLFFYSVNIYFCWKNKYQIDRWEEK
jgi:hypothetical protein